MYVQEYKKIGKINIKIQNVPALLQHTLITKRDISWSVKKALSSEDDNKVVFTLPLLIGLVKTNFPKPTVDISDSVQGFMNYTSRERKISLFTEETCCTYSR